MGQRKVKSKKMIGLSKNKAIRKERMKPLPTELMNNETRGNRTLSGVVNDGLVGSA